jgi:hypothetical protein
VSVFTTGRAMVQIRSKVGGVDVQLYRVVGDNEKWASLCC